MTDVKLKLFLVPNDGNWPNWGMVVARDIEEAMTHYISLIDRQPIGIREMAEDEIITIAGDSPAIPSFTMTAKDFLEDRAPFDDVPDWIDSES